MRVRRSAQRCVSLGQAATCSTSILPCIAASCPPCRPILLCDLYCALDNQEVAGCHAHPRPGFLWPVLPKPAIRKSSALTVSPHNFDLSLYTRLCCYCCLTYLSHFLLLPGCGSWSRTAWGSACGCLLIQTRRLAPWRHTTVTVQLTAAAAAAAASRLWQLVTHSLGQCLWVPPDADATARTLAAHIFGTPSTSQQQIRQAVHYGHALNTAFAEVCERYTKLCVL
jgi:hypothetical protein